MTYRERLMKEHPEINPMFIRGGMDGCPSDYFEVDRPLWCKNMEASFDDCERCWAREVPKKKVTWTILVTLVNGKEYKKTVVNNIEDPADMADEFASTNNYMIFNDSEHLTILPIHNIVSIIFRKENKNDRREKTV